jgi:hypothetical protein
MIAVRARGSDTCLAWMVFALVMGDGTELLYIQSLSMGGAIASLMNWLGDLPRETGYSTKGKEKHSCGLHCGGCG